MLFRSPARESREELLLAHRANPARDALAAGLVTEELGDAPQDYKYAGAVTRLRIGSQNVFREHVTVHRSSKPEEDTIIGDGNYFMAGSHAGHNCVVGSHNTFANGALLAGHVTIADRAFISGNCVIHQFCRVGRLAMMQGKAGISKDLPSFCIARGDNGICGLNVVGLRRAGFTPAQRLELRRLYHHLFRSGERLRVALESAREQLRDPASQELIEFAAASKRGLCADTGLRGHDD